LAGKDEWEKAKVIEIFNFYKDVYNELSPYTLTKLGYREGDAVSNSSLLPFIKYFKFRII